VVPLAQFDQLDYGSMDSIGEVESPFSAGDVPLF
jgi:hypothetical protein